MPEMVAEISLSTTGDSNDSAVMEVVVPHRIKAVAVLLDAADEARILWFVLCEDNGLASICRPTDRVANLSNDVNPVRSLVMNRLCRVQTEAIKMIFIDPMSDVGQKKVAHRLAIFSIKIDGVSPVGVLV